MLRQVFGVVLVHPCRCPASSNFWKHPRHEQSSGVTTASASSTYLVGAPLALRDEGPPLALDSLTETLAQTRWLNMFLLLLRLRLGLHPSRCDVGGSLSPVSSRLWGCSDSSRGSSFCGYPICGATTRSCVGEPWLGTSDRRGRSRIFGRPQLRPRLIVPSPARGQPRAILRWFSFFPFCGHAGPLLSCWIVSSRFWPVRRGSNLFFGASASGLGSFFPWVNFTGR